MSKTSKPGYELEVFVDRTDNQTYSRVRSQLEAKDIGETGGLTSSVEASAGGGPDYKSFFCKMYNLDMGLIILWDALKNSSATVRVTLIDPSGGRIQIYPDNHVALELRQTGTV